MNHFDPQAFLDLPVDVAFEKRPLVPVNDYPALVQEVSSRQWVSKDKTYESGPNAGKPKTGIAYDVKLEVEIPLDVKERVGLKSDFKLVMTDSIMLDLNDQGGLATEAGSNRQLRNYREALDMNKAGVTFRAREMAGRRLLLRIKHEEYPAGSGNFNEKPNGVAALR